MRYAIISDIHANLPALEAVIQDCVRQGVKQIICLGDTVGYGPNPVETLSRIREVSSSIIQGNHDAAICGTLDTSLFNEFAKSIVLKHREELSHEDLDYLRELPLILEADTFICVHGSYLQPQEFYYVSTELEAQYTFQALPRHCHLLFVGHTHIPGVFELQSDNTILHHSPEIMTLQDSSRYIINPGAVGFSRDVNRQATYVIYETDTHQIFFKSVDYSLLAYRRSVIDKDYPLDRYWFLRDINEHDAPVNEPPPSEMEEGMRAIPDHNTAPTPTENRTATIQNEALLEAHHIALAQVQQIKAKNKRLSTLLIVTLCIIIVGIFVIIVFIYMPQKQSFSTQIDESNHSIAFLQEDTYDENETYFIDDLLSSRNLLPSIPIFREHTGKLTGWHYTAQSGSEINTYREIGKNGFTITSSNKENAVTLDSPLITWDTRNGINRIQSHLMVTFQEGTIGFITYDLLQYKPEGNTEVLHTSSSSPADLKRTIKSDRHFTFILKRDTSSVRLSFTFYIKGSVSLYALSLEPLEK